MQYVLLVNQAIEAMYLLLTFCHNGIARRDSLSEHVTIIALTI